MDVTIWSTPKSNQIDYIFCSQRWRSSMQSAKTKPGSDGSDHQLLIAKFRLKLKKVGETSRPFRYDPNQIPYDYTVKEMNRFKGSDLVETECPKNYGGRLVTLCRRQWPKSSQREMQEGKVVVWEEASQKAEERKGYHDRFFVFIFLCLIEFLEQGSRGYQRDLV